MGQNGGSVAMDSGGHIFPEIYIDRGDNGSKFATSASNASGKLSPVSVTPAVNLLPVSKNIGI
jgi:hypothetical protein